MITTVPVVLCVSCNAKAFVNGKLPKLCAMLHPYMQSTLENQLILPVVFCTLCKCDLIEMEEVAL